MRPSVVPQTEHSLGVRLGCLAVDDPPPGVDALVALATYDDDLRRLVLAIKRDGRRDLVRSVARPLAAAARRAGIDDVDVVTWVPSAPEHRVARGFDQGRLLARAVGRRLDVPVRRLLGRRGRSRRGVELAERRSGPSFGALGTVPASVLLIDDVTTTGSSLEGAAAALRAEGAQRVVAVVVARAAARVTAQAHRSTAG